MFRNMRNQPDRQNGGNYLLAPAVPNVHRSTDADQDRRSSVAQCFVAQCFLIWGKSLAYVSLLRSEDDFIGERLFYRHLAPTGRKHLRSTMVLLALFVMAVSAVAQQSANTSTAANVEHTERAPASSANDRYRIGPGDLLDIRFLNRPNL